jgi:hypothetical protein
MMHFNNLVDLFIVWFSLSRGAKRWKRGERKENIPMLFVSRYRCSLRIGNSRVLMCWTEKKISSKKQSVIGDEVGLLVGAFNLLCCWGGRILEMEEWHSFCNSPSLDHNYFLFATTTQQSSIMMCENKWNKNCTSEP